MKTKLLTIVAAIMLVVSCVIAVPSSSATVVPNSTSQAREIAHLKAVIRQKNAEIHNLVVALIKCGGLP